MRTSLFGLFVGFMALCAQALQGQSPVAALHLQNNAGQELNAQMGAFEDLIVSHFTNQGLKIVSARSALDSFSGHNDAVAKETMDSSTLQRLAQSLGANFGLSATITNYAKTTKTFDSYGVKGTNVIHTLRISYQLIDVADGGTVMSDTLALSNTVRQTANLSDDGGSVLSGLLADAATQLADAYGSKVKKVDLAGIAAAQPKAEVTFTLAIASQTISIPSVTTKPDGTFEVRPSAYSVEPAEFVVELDGLAIGSAGAKTEFKALPGLHRLKITRDGYKDWEKSVNIRSGMNLKIEAAQTAEEIAKMKDLVGYFQGLSNTTTLNAAEAEVLKGKAQALRQSGYRIDTQIKSDQVKETNLHIGDTPQTFDLLRDIFEK